MHCPIWHRVRIIPGLLYLSVVIVMCGMVWHFLTGICLVLALPGEAIVSRRWLIILGVIPQLHLFLLQLLLPELFLLESLLQLLPLQLFSLQLFLLELLLQLFLLQLLML